MIPITASILSGTARSGGGRGRTVGLTLVYALGLASVYAVLGLLAGLTGSLFGTVSANPWVMLAVGNLLLLFALFLLDVFPIPVPRRLMEWAGKQEGGSYGAIFLMGAGSGVVAAPCGAPAFAAVLTWVAATQAALNPRLINFTRRGSPALFQTLSVRTRTCTGRSSVVQPADFGEMRARPLSGSSRHSREFPR
jgi:thiol:disulfide interchange protein